MKAETHTKSSVVTCPRITRSDKYIKFKASGRAKADFRTLGSTPMRGEKKKKNTKSFRSEMSALLSLCLPYCCYAITTLFAIEHPEDAVR